jgi:hypothetical protein
MWFNKLPLIEVVYFKKNIADYGNDIASKPSRILLEVLKKFENETRLIYSSKNNRFPAILDNISPGNTIPYILKFSLVDIYGEIVKTANGLFNFYIFSPKYFEKRENLFKKQRSCNFNG